MTIRLLEQHNICVFSSFLTCFDVSCWIVDLLFMNFDRCAAEKWIPMDLVAGFLHK